MVVHDHGFVSLRACTASRWTKEAQRPSRLWKRRTPKPNGAGAPQTAHARWPSGRMVGVTGAAGGVVSWEEGGSNSVRMRAPSAPIQRGDASGQRCDVSPLALVGRGFLG